MTHDMRDDCFTWDYRTKPPAHVQNEIDNMGTSFGTMYEPPEPEVPVPRSRKPDIGKKKNYGYSVPDVVNGMPTAAGDGTVRDALYGWAGSKGTRQANVTFLDGDAYNDPPPGGSTKENMFDLLAHRHLEDSIKNAGGRGGGGGRDGRSAGASRRCPKDPRKNHAYVTRTNAITEKYMPVDHKLWKLPKFEKVPAHLNTRGRSAGKGGAIADDAGLFADPTNDAAYVGIVGKQPSPDPGYHVSSRMDASPPGRPVASPPVTSGPAPQGDLNDNVGGGKGDDALFDV